MCNLCVIDLILNKPTTLLIIILINCFSHARPSQLGPNLPNILLTYALDHCPDVKQTSSVTPLNDIPPQILIFEANFSIDGFLSGYVACNVQFFDPIQKGPIKSGVYRTVCYTTILKIILKWHEIISIGFYPETFNVDKFLKNVFEGQKWRQENLNQGYKRFLPPISGLYFIRMLDKNKLLNFYQLITEKLKLKKLKIK
ncbi:hypothetical protein BpHYR1_009578 [Brachionus plicatilis]|uniref:Uncharacterized protein n=1 Tax=Brachionus plicatilis TaxID=10195 RepID=A0A3M7QEK4_BRAPC|nr:hypothetical protein BpHYR1_009578 [Brachionus plicatilis]